MRGSNLQLILGEQFINSFASITLVSVLLIAICSTMVEVSGGFVRMRPLLKGILRCREESPVWRIMAHWNRYGISIGVSVMLLGFIFEQGIIDLMHTMLVPAFICFMAAAVIIRLWETAVQKRQGIRFVKISGVEWKLYIKDGLPVLILAACVVYFIWKREYIGFLSCFCVVYGLVMAACYLPRNLKTYWHVLEITLSRAAAAGMVWGIMAVYTRCAEQFHLMDGAEQMLFDFLLPFPAAAAFLLMCAAAVLISTVVGMVPVIIVYTFPMTLVVYSLGADAAAAMTAGLFSTWLGNLFYVYRRSRNANVPVADESQVTVSSKIRPVTEERIDGYLTADIKGFLADNEQYYVKRFYQLCQGKLKFNLCAMLFGETWFAYKGMWKNGIILCFINSVLGTVLARQYTAWDDYRMYGDGILLLILLLGIIRLAVGVWIGLNGDKFYWNHMTKKLNELNCKGRMAEEDEELRGRIAEQGNTSMINILLMGVIRLVIVWLILAGFR